MPSLVLADRVPVGVTGEDAEHLLHNVLTCDVEGLKAGIARPGALLTPQGKVLFDFLVARDGDGFVIDIDADQADAFLKRMMLYKLRSKADFSKRDESLVAVSWDDESGVSDDVPADARFPDGLVRRLIYDAANPPQDTADRSDWDRLRIDHGVPESGRDFALGDAFGHDISFDQNGGLDFKKGCFVGQEVVSRMQHRGTARRRVVIVKGAGALPDTGADILASGKPAGTLGTVVGDMALAIVRLDRIQKAADGGAPVLAGDVPVTVSLPPNVTYAWPQADADAANA